MVQTSNISRAGEGGKSRGGYKNPLGTMPVRFRPPAPSARAAVDQAAAVGGRANCNHSSGYKQPAGFDPQQSVGASKLDAHIPQANKDYRLSYVELQTRRAATGQVSDARWRKCKSVIRARLDLYVGSRQIHLIGQDRWDDYPTWRRETGKGRLREQVSDATIGFEMSTFGAVMNFAAKKRYIMSAGAHRRQESA